MQKQRPTIERVILYILLSSFPIGLVSILLSRPSGQFTSSLIQGLERSIQTCSNRFADLFAVLLPSQIAPASWGLRVLVLLLPIGLIWVERQRLQRLSQANLARGWCGYLGLLNWITLGIWAGWIGLFGLEMSLPELLHGFHGLSQESLSRESLSQDGLSRESLSQEIEAVLLLVLPPILAIAGCYALSYPLFKRVGGSRWTRSGLMQQVVWGQLRGMLPLALCFSGCRLFFNHHLPEAMLLFGATYLSQIGLAHLASQANQAALQALTAGELRNRIFALAQPAGVQLQQVYILPSQGNVNAFAAQNGNVVLTDQLLQHLNKREIDAIVAHELAHLQYKHPQTLQLILLIAISGTLGSLFLWGQWASLAVVPLAAILLFGVYYFYARRFEYEADRQAIQLTQDPVAMITGLVKLAQLTRTPFDWGKYTGLFMAHPSLRQRVQAIGQHHGLSTHQLQQVLESQILESPSSWVGASPHYRLPEALTQAPILFSSRLKQQITLWLEWRLVLALTFPLAAIVWLQPESIGLYSLGWLLTLGLGRLTVKISPQTYKKLRCKLAQKLQQQLNPKVWNGRFVGLAPDEALRRYEGLPHWDMGFLFLEGDRLCYVGEQTGFALYSTHITQITLEPQGWGGWQAASLMIRWHDGLDGGSFRIYDYESSGVKQQAANLCSLKQRLDRWQTRNWTQSLLQGSDPFVTLTPPRLGTVTSEALDSHLLKQFGNGLVKLLAVGLAVCVGLPEITAYSLQTYSQIYILGGSVLGLLLQFLPWALDQKNLPSRTIQNQHFAGR